MAPDDLRNNGELGQLFKESMVILSCSIGSHAKISLLLRKSPKSTRNQGSVQRRPQGFSPSKPIDE
jgi:hypothetical protein